MNGYNNDLFDIFSDLYKDVNGFRPRGMTATRFMALSQEEAEKELDQLGEDLERVMLEEQEAQLHATLAFLEAMRKVGSMSKGIMDELAKVNNDPDAVDYAWGMKFGTTHKLAGCLMSQVKQLNEDKPF